MECGELNWSVIHAGNTPCEFKHWTGLANRWAAVGKPEGPRPVRLLVSVQCARASPLDRRVKWGVAKPLIRNLPRRRRGHWPSAAPGTRHQAYARKRISSAGKDSLADRAAGHPLRRHGNPRPKGGDNGGLAALEFVGLGPILWAWLEFFFLMKTLSRSFGRTACLVFAMLAVAVRADPTMVSDEDGHFTATFPADVSRSNRIVDTDAGQIILCKVVAAQGAASFMVIYSDYPEGYVASTGAASVYKGAVKEAADNVKGALRSQSSCKLGGVDGLEVLIDGPNREFVERARFFVVGDRLFQVAYIGKPDSETGKAATDFLDSFRLRPPPATTS